MPIPVLSTDVNSAASRLRPSGLKPAASTGDSAAELTLGISQNLSQFAHQLIRVLLVNSAVTANEDIAPDAFRLDDHRWNGGLAPIRNRHHFRVERCHIFARKGKEGSKVQTVHADQHRQAKLQRLGDDGD